jgi:4-hydroxy-tetrahydrodipicolinate reductase
VGPIGASVVKLLLRKGWARLVGAVDVDKGKVGRDLGDVVGAGKKLGLHISATLSEALRDGGEPDVVIQCTGSYLQNVESQLTEIITAGADVVSTCEELAFPHYRQPSLSSELDRFAKLHDVSVLGTGVNPGFVMDFLPTVMSGACQEIRTIRVQRVVDAAQRREPLQRKVGAGLTAQEFKEKVATGQIKHVGLPESAALIAAGLGWKLASIEETIDPVITDEKIRTEYLTVEKGCVAGVRQTARGLREDAEVISLDLQMYAGAKNPHDSIDIDGTPPVVLQIDGGLHGDFATAAIVVNCIPKITSAKPGLLTMLDIQPVHLS